MPFRMGVTQDSLRVQEVFLVASKVVSLQAEVLTASIREGVLLPVSNVAVYD